MITGMVASPSSPSVRFTALPNADHHERREDDSRSGRVGMHRPEKNGT